MSVLRKTDSNLNDNFIKLLRKLTLLGPVSAQLKLTLQREDCLDKIGADAVAALRVLADLETGRGDSLHSRNALKVRSLFDQFDADGDGWIATHQFKCALEQLGLGAQFSPQELEQLARVAESDHDGQINIKEFTTWLYCGNDGATKSSSESLDSPPLRVRASLPHISPDLQSHGLEPTGLLAAPEGQSLSRTHRAHRPMRSPVHRQVFRRSRTPDLTDSRLVCQCSALRSSLDSAEARVKELEKSKARAEERFDEEHDALQTFWRSVAESSATPKLKQELELGTAALLGNGKYGYVFKCRRTGTRQLECAKMLSLRWAHVAAKEWNVVSLIGKHSNVVEYRNVMLHADTDHCIQKLLIAGQDSGQIQARTKKVLFPDRFIVLLLEFMNRGTVQDWMDKNVLLPGGILKTMRCVAAALAHMHKCRLVHNDVKPENVLLCQVDEKNPRAEVLVKLADFGLSEKSLDKSADFAHYGMTVLCMTTGEKFGHRKHHPEKLGTYVANVVAWTGESEGRSWEQGNGSIRDALKEVPELLRHIWGVDGKQCNMAQVRDSPAIQNWHFFDGELLNPVPEAGENVGDALVTESANKLEGQVSPTLCRSIFVEQVFDTSFAAQMRKSAELRDEDACEVAHCA